MPLETYEELIKCLKQLGLTGQMQNADQLIVSTQTGPVWPNRGNSFWLSRKEGAWYLSTWLPVGYRVPPTQDVLALCSECMGFGNSAMFRVPPEIISRFGLQELDESDYEGLFSTKPED
jgi:hypothetical protein